jgi:hypothetical protein
MKATRRMGKKLDFGRRAFLRGLGGFAIALPLLEATHGDAWGGPGGAPSGAPLRFIVLFRHGGTATNVGRYQINQPGDKFDGTGSEQGQNLWAPKDPGENLVLGPIHSILGDHKDNLLVVTGVDNAAGVIQSPYNGEHGWANKSILTSAKITEVSNGSGGTTQIAQGASIDQVIAQRLRAQNALPFTSVNLGIYGHQYGTPFSQGAGQPLEGETSPAKAFDTYLGGVQSGTPNPELVRRQAMGVSVLEGASEGYRRLQSKISSQDKQVVDAHLTHLSELERRIKALQTVTCSVPTIDRSVTEENQEKVGPIMVDIMLATLRCGLTQVATLDIADIITSWLPEPYGPVGFDIGHSLHHIARDCGATGTEGAKQQPWLDEMLVNRQWCMGLFKRLLEGLKSIPEGNGTMLDNSLMFYTSEFSNGSVHSENDMPLLLAGSAGGYFRTGRHINCNKATAPFAYQSNTGTHNLYTSMLNAFGIEDTHFGVDLPGLGFKGPLPGLT